MAREDVDLIRRLYEAPDAETVLAAFDPDVVWTTAEGEVDGGTFRGIAAVRGLFERWREAFQGFRMDTSDVSQLGDWVVTRGCWYGTARRTGMKLEYPVVIAYRVRGGRVVEAREFRDMDQAIAALGG